MLHDRLLLQHSPDRMDPMSDYDFSYTFSTREAEEAAIQRYGRQTARRVRLSFANEWGQPLDGAAAVDISDACRDEAYDILVAAGRQLAAGHDLVDLLHMDVTEVATEIILSGAK
jgi:hypothetical protein